MGIKCCKSDFSELHNSEAPNGEFNQVDAVEEGEDNISDTSYREEDEIISLDVGGRVFKTSKQTLLKAQRSKLAGLANGQEVFPRQDDGSYFIDRDPERFRHVLNFLRDGDFLPSKDNTSLRHLLFAEAVFYNINELIDETSQTFWSLVKCSEICNALPPELLRTLASWITEEPWKHEWKLVDVLSWENKEGEKTKLEKQLNEKVTFVKDAPTAFVIKSGDNVFGAYGEKFSQLIRRRRYNGRIESFENDQRFLSELKKEWSNEPGDIQRRQEIKAKASRLLVAEYPYPDWPGVHTGLSLGSNTTASFLFSLRSPRGTKAQRVDIVAEDRPRSIAFLHGHVGDLEIFNGYGISRLGFFYKCPEGFDPERFFTENSEFPLDRVEMFQLHCVT